jgi:addiction module HigA family antidote
MSKPIHPGEVLREDFLLPLELSQYRVAKDIGVPPRRINEIVKGQRRLTADTSLRLERYFSWPAEVWLNLQSHYDQEIAGEGLKAELAGIKACPALPAA